MGEEVLAERGIAALSLREVARRLGVSHNAPFKHFASREALLAAMAEQGFEDLAARLAGAMTGAPREAMTGRALAYGRGVALASVVGNSVARSNTIEEDTYVKRSTPRSSAARKTAL